MKGLNSTRIYLGALLMAAGIFLQSCEQKSAAQTAIDRGYAFLGRIQRADGAICDTLNPLFDTWETVAAASAIWDCYQNPADTVLNKALRFLQSQENTAQLLCHNVKCRQSSCLETSAEYLILRSKIYGPSAIGNRLDSIGRLQLPTGEWEVGNPDVLESKAFPSVTGFVLAAYQAASLSPPNLAAARSWLCQQQSPNGDWGAHWEYYGCEAYALWANLRALRAVQSPEAAAAVQKAEAYIGHNQSPAGFWESKAIAGPQKASATLQTALMLQALDGSQAVQTALLRSNGNAYLLQVQRPDGSWDGGFFPIASTRYRKEEYVFATAHAMQALHLMSTQDDAASEKK